MIFFRADGNSKIGAGHIMRCLSIADAAMEVGEKIVFYTAGDELSKTIVERKINNKVIGTDFMKMESELVYLKEELLKYKPKYIFVDSYYVTKKYLTTLLNCCHSYGGKLVYVDDLMAFAYPCDYLINYNIYGPDMKDTYIKIYADDRIVEGKSRYPKMLLGIKYVPLRKEFTNLPPRNVRKNPRNILVSTGGADTEHVAIEIVRQLVEMKSYMKTDYRFHIIIGAMNGDRTKIELLAAKSDNIELHINVKDMVGLMRKCDIAISAAGSTLYELCATQTPTITYVVADNQMLGAESFQKRGIMKYLGDIRKEGTKLLVSKMLQEAIRMLTDKEIVNNAFLDNLDGSKSIIQEIGV
ncbi:MAG: UDP-2,4-diacetamido-2,4,6-trideoxy-beta-L-altropyranose hydrolase [Pseudobutyrivibrio ruminis]|uniref:UDP-2,4-diacetamido-2,4, 6-trideoxy-beta-L-altropyranose hydrolase n=1 Tax=Pseudobutyrivibrio ruminis TaxID=46206 RepID=UPI0026E99A35|nr:UDP-2,4-diacetamido-2,4,6-trideoxy-beta-L-altropyranose hydrolase [Pseudobutyrivibrio ruminis]MBE5912910.1 UDP-2,4-diacetamido-2,4,6-trideoxy-beta-L-altropyranose hydrolase [Pseudobutyrivibrio ruminis]